MISQKNGSISFLDQNLKEKLNLPIHTNEVRSVEKSEEHQRFVTSSFDNRICLVDEPSMSKTYITHNSAQNSEESCDNVVYAGFHPSGAVASCSRLGLCNIYSFR